jgi:hypothetical protein
MAYTIRNALLKDVEQVIVKAGVVGIVDKSHGAEQYVVTTCTQGVRLQVSTPRGSIAGVERRLRKVQTGSCTVFNRVFYKELEEGALQDCRREHDIAYARNKNSSSLKGAVYLSIESPRLDGLDARAHSTPGSVTIGQPLLP